MTRKEVAQVGQQRKSDDSGECLGYAALHIARKLVIDLHIATLIARLSGLGGKGRRG